MKLEKQLQSKEMEEFLKAVVSLKDREEAMAFFRDVFTLEELEEASRRFQVANMLNDGDTFEQIQQETGMSATTISRINYWLHHGMGGYKLMLKRRS
ncbi:hypothetical protein CL629_00880 [bacterium]|nr:hypothetical protein [bacterium]